MLAHTRLSIGTFVGLTLLLGATAVAQNQSQPVLRWNVKHDVSHRSARW